MGRFISRVLGIHTQFIFLVSVREALKTFSNEPIFTIFTIFIICVSLSFTQELLVFTVTVESSTLYLILEKIDYLMTQGEILLPIAMIWVISIQLQATINLL